MYTYIHTYSGAVTKLCNQGNLLKSFFDLCFPRSRFIILWQWNLAAAGS